MGRSKADEWRTEDGLIRIKGWARDGLTQAEIADEIGVNVSTLIAWKQKFSEIYNALKRGKDVADRNVEESLYAKATGFVKKIQKPIKMKRVNYDDNGKKLSEEEYIGYAEEEVYFPPDTTAQIFWLKNRKPHVWRDKPEAGEDNYIEAAGVIEIPIVEVNDD